MSLQEGQISTALALTLLGALGTTLGGFLMILHPGMSLHQLGILQGVAAGLMLCISVMDLLPDAVENLGFQQAHVAFYLGAAFFAVVTCLMPEPNLDAMLKQQSPSAQGWGRCDWQILMSGLITAVGIALHNFPEGVSVFLASLQSTATGLNLALAIALHNIPEGVAVALPVYFATQSRWTGFKYAALSGLAEPLAVIVMAVLLTVFSVELSEAFVNFTVASVGGIMAYISFHELIPLSLTHCGKTKMTMAVFVGMAIMSVNLYVLHG